MVKFCGSVTLILSFRLSKPYLVKAEGDEKDNVGQLLPVRTVLISAEVDITRHISLKAIKYIATRLIRLRLNIKYIRPTTDSGKPKIPVLYFSFLQDLTGTMNYEQI
jgi:hypothetical protein